eukprot:CAMPEP_0170765012 /NCGR_PEP_ID=MMETSP0733-20121128/4354_1 /TAXON_ID=186038 /ORGANISM="Fragilariopsis kerguelensis, Strain L26-C5" /LENGTH=904 /DNA_ID=CAMNT_0011105787 /DNA_START=319 /DNA_END=3033 /DNA_ORIENTATION=-
MMLMLMLLLLFMVHITFLRQGNVAGGGDEPSTSFFTTAFVVAPRTRTSRSTSTTSASPITTTSQLHLRVAYQGEPGAYSEKSTRELLGDAVLAIGKSNFEHCFRAVASMEVDYCCLPIENSLGGSIHENYDLLLRYDLTIVAEHEFRVQHCVLGDPTEIPLNQLQHRNRNGQIKYAISHPQALAQCDNYLRSLNIQPVPTYDTAGSAKMILENDLPPGCTPSNTVAIASDLAGETYGMHCFAKGVEDDDSNFTRFLLLGRKGVLEYLGAEVPSKTSVVFTLPNTPGALYKALACFSLRDIDFSKIESRPTSAALLNYLKFRKAANTANGNAQHQQQQQDNNEDSDTDRNNNNSNMNDEEDDLPRFRYCFYLDFLEGQLSRNSENALANLREFTDFVRILGSYPRKSRLVGPVAQAAEEMKLKRLNDIDYTLRLTSQSSSSLMGTDNNKNGDDEDNEANGGDNNDNTSSSLLKIGLVGFGSYGQVFARQMIQQKHRVSCLDKEDKSEEAEQLGVDFHFHAKEFFQQELDVVVLSVPLIALEETVQSLPVEELSGKLVVDIGPLNDHPKAILLEAFANDPTIDVLITNPLLGMLPKNVDTTTTTTNSKTSRKQSNRKNNRNNNNNNNGGYSTTTNNGGGGGVVVMAPSYATSSNGSGSGSDSASGTSSIWEGRQMIYERARVADIPRCDKYLKIFENARCEIMEEGGGITPTPTDDPRSTGSTHDVTIGDAEFVTHLIGRLLDDRDLLTPTPIMSKEYTELTNIAQMASNGSFDRFYGMYKYSTQDRAQQRIKKLRDNLAALECELAARGAYLAAKKEMIQGDRQKLLAETRSLLQELAKSSSPSSSSSSGTSASSTASSSSNNSESDIYFLDENEVKAKTDAETDAETDADAGAENETENDCKDS